MLKRLVLVIRISVLMIACKWHATCSVLSGGVTSCLFFCPNLLMGGSVLFVRGLDDGAAGLDPAHLHIGLVEGDAAAKH